MKTLLQNARIQKDWKVKDLAQKTGIDQALVSKYENGKRLPSKSHIFLLAETLNIDHEEIMVQWLKTKILEDVEGLSYAIPAINEALHTLNEKETMYKTDEQKWKTVHHLDSLKSSLADYRPIDSAKVKDALGLEYTYESNRIEGNTLTLNETHLIISEGMTVSGKSMREHLETLNHQEAIDYIQDAVKDKVPISERFVKELHYLVLKGIDPDNAGSYRSVQVMIQGSDHLPPQPILVPEQMEALITWYREHKSTMHPVVLAAEMHHRLVSIHPFIDGNGRTSRLLMNLILLQNGYVIANIKGDTANRLRYYDALEKSQSDSDKKDFIEFIIDVEKQCLERYLLILGGKT